jgi:peptidoglycan DL-endopeptidase CwlO
VWEPLRALFLACQPPYNPGMRWIALVLLVAGCAPRMRFPGPVSVVGKERQAVAPIVPREDAGARDGAGVRVARAAASFVGKGHLIVKGKRYRWDCSGFVEAAYAKAGLDYEGSSADLYATARAGDLLQKGKTPRVGDVAFFDDTYDRNHNGRRDDELSHVAIVESIDAAGTITLVHNGSRGIVRIHMNLRRPHDRTDENGAVLNDPLRAAKAKDHGPVLTAELFRAFGSLWEPVDAIAEH